MKVYLVYRSYFDGADNWDSLIHVALDPAVASALVDALQEKDGNELISFYVELADVVLNLV